MSPGTLGCFRLLPRGLARVLRNLPLHLGSGCGKLSSQGTVVCRPERQAKCDFQGLAVSQATGASRELCEVGIRLDLASLEARPWLCFPEVSSSSSVLTAEVLSVLPGAGSTWLPSLSAAGTWPEGPGQKTPCTRAVDASHHPKPRVCGTVACCQATFLPKSGPLRSPLLCSQRPQLPAHRQNADTASSHVPSPGVDGGFGPTRSWWCLWLGFFFSLGTAPSSGQR